MADDENRPLTHGRDLHAYLDSIGAKQPNRAEALELLRGVQMGVQVDDARHLVRPITVPLGHYWAYEGPGGAGVYSAVLVTSNGGSGIYIPFLFCNAASHSISTEGIPVFTQTGAAIPPSLIPGDVEPVSLVLTGTTVALPAPAGVPLTANVGYHGCPLFLPRGTSVMVQQRIANTACSAGLGIQEIP